MDKRSTRLINELKKFKKELSNKYHIDKLILFGSRAKGKYKRYSDVDLTIISKDFKNIKFIDRNRGLYIMWDFDYPVDFFCYTPDEFERMRKKMTIGKIIDKEGIVV